MTAEVFDGARIDHSEPTPLYKQLESIVLEAVNRGDFAPGEMIPTERELEERFGVSRITVRRALSDLAAAGYLRREPGRGSFVIRTAIDDSTSRRLGTLMDVLKAEGRGVSFEMLHLGWEAASREVAEAFGITPGTEVMRFDRLFFVDGTPTYLCRHWAKLTKEKGDLLTCDSLKIRNIWEALREYCGISLTSGEQILQAVGANPEEARLLRVPEGTPLMLVRYILRDQVGEVYAYCKLSHLGTSYKLHLNLNSI